MRKRENNFVCHSVMSFSPPQSTVSTPRCERWRNVEPATQTLLTHCWWSFTHLVFACFCTGMQLWITRSMRWGDRQKPPKVKTQETSCFSKQLCLFFLLLYPSKGWRTGLSWCQLTGRRQLSPLPHPLWAILDTGAYLTKLLPASVLFFFFSSQVWLQMSGIPCWLQISSPLPDGAPQGQAKCHAM